MQEALEEQNKARIEQAKKMDTLIKRMDHTERARRENEAPLLQEAYAQKVKASFPIHMLETSMLQRCSNVNAVVTALLTFKAKCPMPDNCYSPNSFVLFWLSSPSCPLHKGPCPHLINWMLLTHVF